MDFKFLEFLKEIINDALYTSIAKLAIAFYCLKKVIQFIITGINIAFKTKEKANEYIELKKDVIDLKKDNIENKERDLKTHDILKELQQDVNAYKKRTHKIESQDIANLKIIERSTDAIEKNINLLEKLNNKL